MNLWRRVIVHKKIQQSVVLLATTLFFVSLAMATEEPKYSVIEKTEPYELREYAPQIVAEVQVGGDMDAASGEGFRLIAAYIFGKNQVQEKMSMTTPVTIESSKGGQSQKIAMTAPVTIEANNSSNLDNKSLPKLEWTVAFVMPSEYTLSSLPKPLDPRIQIREIPAEKKAVIVFSGRYNEAKVTDQNNALEAWIKTKHWQIIGEPQFARYNPPWTLPFMRRNEILISVRDQAK
jgi:effector-binding domain-containing protein